MEEVANVAGLPDDMAIGLVIGNVQLYVIIIIVPTQYTCIIIILSV